MFRKAFFVGLVIFAGLVAGCSNSQSSSMEEASYQATKLSGWKENLWLFNISSGTGLLFFSADPLLRNSTPKIGGYDYSLEGGDEIVYLLIWRDNSEKLWVSGFNDERPPKEVFTEPLEKKKKDGMMSLVPIQ